MSSASGIIPTQPELEFIPEGVPTDFYPHEWIEISPASSSFEVIFYARLGSHHGLSGDISVFLKNHPDPAGSIIKGYWLLMRSGSTPRVYKYDTTIAGHYPLGNVIITESFHAPMWHKMVGSGTTFTAYSSSSSSGPWTAYYSTTLSGLSSYTHIGFATYAESQPLYMSSFSANFPFPAQPAPTIDWQNDGDDTYSATTRYQRTYHLATSVVYNHSTSTTALTGPLSRDHNGGKWAYDSSQGHPATSASPGGWTWLSVINGSSQYNYSYNASTKIWEPVGWSSSSAPESLKTLIPWTYSPSTLTWDSGRGETWTYDIATKKWTCIITSYEGDNISFVWSFDYATSRWTNETNNEAWSQQYELKWQRVLYWGDVFNVSPQNGLALKWSSKYSGPGGNGQFFVGNSANFYQSNDISQKFYWLKPDEANPYGRYSGYEGAAGTYLLNHLRQWRLNGSSTLAYITPRVPPLVVVQHQDIIYAYDTAEAQEILSSTPTPTATWTNNGRSNEFGLAIPYDTGEGTAPLKVTTTDPNTQLLSNLLHSPVFTSLGDWQFIDSTNGHTWTFEDATGVWTNNTTGYQIQYSNPRALCWHDTTSNTDWEYDENNKTWIQIIEEQTS